MACVNNIGCFPACEPIEIFPAEVSGDHIIEWEWLGIKRTLTIDGVEGESIMLPNVFNEHSTFNLTIQAPNGQYYDNEGELTDEQIILQITIK